MEILAIRGENLASIGSGFNIDLTAEPLKSAGIFAITGDTGAGKSTILDAMCLALYGNCPRLSSGGVDDDVPDQGGDAIKSSDPRSLLRRGVTHGFAEVDFLSHEGIAYRARWTVRRARGKDFGRLQTVERALLRVQDGVMLATQINQVNARIAQELRLTYEEFRRTVLLAQGDFDAFLRASTSERAALLEKITGTQIYREISKAAYDRNDKIQGDLKIEEARLDGIRILTQEEQDLLRSRLSEAHAQVTEKDERTGQFETRLTQRREQDQAYFRAVEAKAAEERAARALQDLSADRVTLTDIDRIEPLRPLHTGLLRRSQDIAHCEEETARIATDLRTMMQMASRKEQARDAARLALNGIEEKFKGFGPIWSEATRLDDRLVSLSTDLQQAKAKRQEIANLQDRARLDSEEAGRRISGLLAAVAGRKEQALRVAWAPRLSVLLGPGRSRLEGHIDMRNRILEIDALLRDNLEDLNRIRAEITADGVATENLTRDHQGLLAKLAEIEKTLANLRTGASREALDAAERKHHLLSDLQMNLRGLADLNSRRIELETTMARARERQEFVQAKGQELAGRISDIERLIQALLQPVRLAEDAASDFAAQLRSHLEAGCACPVCGATEHPLREAEGLDHVARTLRATLEKHQNDIQAARRCHGECLTEIASLETMMRDRNEQHQELLARISNDEALCQARLADLDMSNPDPADLDRVLADLEAERRRLMATLQKIETLQAQERDLSVQARATAEALRKRAEQDAANDRHLVEIEMRRTEATTERGLLEARLADGLGIVTEIMTLIERSVESFEREGKGLIAKLDQILDWWTRNEARIAEDQNQIETERSRHAIILERLQSGHVQMEEAEASVLARSERLEVTRVSRAALLDGEDTERHRSRINAERLTHQGNLEAASQEHTQAQNQLAALQERDRGLTERLKTLRAAFDAEQRDFAQSLLAYEMDEPLFSQLVSMPPDKIEMLRSRLTAAERDHARAQALAIERQSDVERSLAAGPVPESPEAIETEITGLRREITGLRETIGAISEQLGADERRRMERDRFERDLEQKRLEARTWAAVNAAIGQRSGNRFAQFAQAITLSIMVDRANLHLATLRPRYRLRKGGDDLSLQIIDRDMGDEVRSTRSLSGGERFLISLSMALALSGMGSGGGIARTLFIDEGFGSLDQDSLEMAMDALERLQSQGRTIGLISHVIGLKSRIPVQIRVERRAGGKSRICLPGPI